MNNHNYTLKQAIDAMLEQSKMREQFDEVKLVGGWDNLMGKTIARYTKKMYVNKGVLYLYVESAAMKQELAYNKEKVIKLVNDFVRESYITDVVIW
jgi:predicted nucleic acid-binding Zn ribbon protein